MRFVLEEWTSALPKALQEFSPEEVEDLETRIMQLMLQLRTARRPIEPPPVRRPRRTTAVA